MEIKYLKNLVFVSIVLFFGFSCEKSNTIETNSFESDTVNPPVKRKLTTIVSDLSYTKVRCGGVIDSAVSPSATGLYYNSIDNPGLYNKHIQILQIKENMFNSMIYRLNPGTRYFVEAFAVYGKDTLFGDRKEFATTDYETFVDSRDNRTYKYMKIGEQYWLAENVAYLPTVNSLAEESSTIAMYYVYDYNGNNIEEAKNTENYKTYGVLYNFTAAQNCCPAGWHLPDELEWDELTNYIKTQENPSGSGSCDLLRSIGKIENGTGLWLGSEEGFNCFGFSALPAGNRYPGGSFNMINEWTYFWINSQCQYSMSYLYSDRTILCNYDLTKDMGVSVRCIKD